MTAPLFAVRPVAWEEPNAEAFDAVMLTSANAVRHGGGGLDRYLALPCYAVGGATADAAGERGFVDIRAGDADAAALVARMAADGVRHALHLRGVHGTPCAAPFSVSERLVYESVAVDALPDVAHSAVADGCCALLYSPRAAALFAKLVERANLDRGNVHIVAISAPAAAAAGSGWRSVAYPVIPSDAAMLELAAKLCQTGAVGGAKHA